MILYSSKLIFAGESEERRAEARGRTAAGEGAERDELQAAAGEVGRREDAAHQGADGAQPRAGDSAAHGAPHRGALRPRGAPRPATSPARAGASSAARAARPRAEGAVGGGDARGRAEGEEGSRPKVTLIMMKAEHS